MTLAEELAKKWLQHMRKQYPSGPYIGDFDDLDNVLIDGSTNVVEMAQFFLHEAIERCAQAAETCYANTPFEGSRVAWRNHGVAGIVAVRIRSLKAESLNCAGSIPDGVPCSHPGCLQHVTHPCEGCGRISGRSVPNPQPVPTPDVTFGDPAKWQRRRSK